jgi:hypothetical protein
LAAATEGRGTAVALDEDEDEDEAACVFVMYSLQTASSVIMYLSFASAHMVEAAA